MPDLALSVLVSRVSLGLPNLQLNDHVDYYVGPQLFGGQVQWNKTQATSPFVDGAVTTFRSRQLVSEQLIVEVLGDNPGEVQANLNVLLAAFVQDNFVIDIGLGATHYRYYCEASDYQLAFTGPRVIADQIQVTLGVPRQPVPVTGVA